MDKGSSQSQPSGAPKSAAPEAPPAAAEPDRLTRALTEFDDGLRYAESDANADADLLGHVYANVDVTSLRLELAKIKGLWAFLREEVSGALKIAEHGMTAAHNLRATDLSAESFDSFLAAGTDRRQLEFMTDFGSELRLVERALAALEPSAQATTDRPTEPRGAPR